MVAALLRRRRGGSGFGYLAANGYTPSLAADFVRGRYAYAVSHAGGYRPQRCDFADLFTHSRSGNATQTGSDGTLQWAPHNLLTYSEDFSNAAWTKERNTATANAATAPNGNGTASSIVPTAVSGTHTVIQSFTPVPEVECPFYFKANGYDYVSVRVDNAASKRVIQSFNISSGAKDGSLTQATFTGSSTITDLGDGWYKCTVRAVWDGTSLISRVVLFVNETPGNTEGETFTGDGSSGIYVWGAHPYRSDLGGMASVPADERGLSTSATYLPTTSAARYLPRQNHHVYEGGQWVNKGLLIESESRTNLMTYSEAFSNAAWTKVKCSISADQNDGPGGASTMDKIVEDSSLGEHAINFNQASTASQVYTGSVYCASAGRTIARLSFANLANSNVWFDLSSGTVLTQGAAVESATVENMGGGVYRLRATWTATSTVNYFAFGPASADNVATYTGDGSSGIYVWGAQLEAGSTPSSYTPTSGSTVTRAAETLTIDSTLLPYSSTGMSIAMRGTVSYADENSGTNVLFARWTIDSSARIETRLDTASAAEGRMFFLQSAGGVSDFVQEASPGSYSPGVNQSFSIASRHEDGSINGSVDGTALTADNTPTALPDLSATDMEVAYDFMGTVSDFHMWGESIGDDGLEASSA